MFPIRLRLLSIASIVALAACSGASIGTPPQMSSVDAQYTQLRQELPDALPGPQSGFLPFTSANPVRPVCAPAQPGHAQCFALQRTDLRPMLASNAIPMGIGFGPADLQSAYKVTNASTAGKGQTVAIVDAYGYPNAAKDLAVYRKAAGLPPCTIASGCLKILNQNGATKPLPKANTIDDWRPEEALDMDMVSAMCPNCHIMLIQSKDTFFNNLGTAENAAIAKGVPIVSNSFGGGEGNSAPSGDAHFEHPGHVIVASAGDTGAYDGGTGAQQPCAYQGVVCVGGTALVKAANTRGWSETTWNTLGLFACGGYCGGTGSGCSKFVAKPAWQSSQTICSMRAEADIAADASVQTPVAVYVSSLGGWNGFGGTSAAAPIIAGMVALAGNATTAAQPQRIWKANKSQAFFDVVKGSNVNKRNPCPHGDNKYICNARAGYDGPTGWGSPHGLSAL